MLTQVCSRSFSGKLFNDNDSLRSWTWSVYPNIKTPESGITLPGWAMSQNLFSCPIIGAFSDEWQIGPEFEPVEKSLKIYDSAGK